MKATDHASDPRTTPSRWIPLWCMFLFGGFAWWFFGARYADLLYTVQEGDIFPYDRFFAVSQILQPAGFHFYGTSFLIQFFYYPLLGGAILTLELCGIAWFMARLLRLHGLTYPIAFIPSGLLMVFFTHVGYLATEYDLLRLYTGAIQGFWLSLIWSYVHLLWQRRSTPIRVGLDTLWLVVGYPLLGVFALLGSLWAILRMWTERAENAYLHSLTPPCFTHLHSTPPHSTSQATSPTQPFPCSAPSRAERSDTSTADMSAAVTGTSITSRLVTSSESVGPPSLIPRVGIRHTVQGLGVETLVTMVLVLCVPYLLYLWNFAKFLHHTLIWTVGLQTDVFSLFADTGITFGSWKSIGLTLVVSGILPILSYVFYRIVLPRFAHFTFQTSCLEERRRNTQSPIRTSPTTVKTDSKMTTQPVGKAVQRYPSSTTSAIKNTASVKKRGTIQENRSASPERSADHSTASSLLYSLPLLFLILLCGGAVRFSLLDEAFLATLSMGRQLESQQWEKMLEIASRCDRTSFSMIGLQNLALFELGESADNMFMWPQTSTASGAEEVAFIRKMYSAQILYRYGMVNHAQRAVMNRMVSGAYPAVEPLKMLADVAIVQQNAPLARRCLRMLSHTLFHRRWAEQRLALLARDLPKTPASLPHRMDISTPSPSMAATSSAEAVPSAEISALVDTSKGTANTTQRDSVQIPTRTRSAYADDSDPLALEYEHIYQRGPCVDSFNQQKQAQATIYYQMLEYSYQPTALPEMQELQLVYYLMGSELDLFEQCVSVSQVATARTKIPRHFQEALLLLASERPELLKKCSFSPTISQRFDHLYPFLLNYREDHDLPKLRAVLQRDYPDTYWNFFLNRLTLPFEPNLR